MTTEEEAILRAQHMDLIYAQFGILYEIIPEGPQSTHSVEKPKRGPILMVWSVQLILSLYSH